MLLKPLRMACRQVQILSATADIIIITTTVEDITTTITTMDISMAAGILAVGPQAGIMTEEDFLGVGTLVVDTMGAVAVEGEAAMEEVAD